MRRRRPPAARGAGSFGKRSSSSWPTGWFVRSPSRRATISVPKRDGTSSPRACAAILKSLPGPLRPSTSTRRRSRSAMVTEVSGPEGRRAGLPVRPASSWASSSRVRLSAASERLDVRRHQPSPDDDADLGLRPRGGARVGRRERRDGQAGAREGREQEPLHHQLHRRSLRGRFNPCPWRSRSFPSRNLRSARRCSARLSSSAARRPSRPPTEAPGGSPRSQDKPTTETRPRAAQQPRRDARVVEPETHVRTSATSSAHQATRVVPRARGREPADPGGDRLRPRLELAEVAGLHARRRARSPRAGGPRRGTRARRSPRPSSRERRPGRSAR